MTVQVSVVILELGLLSVSLWRRCSRLAGQQGEVLGSWDDGLEPWGGEVSGEASALSRGLWLKWGELPKPSRTTAGNRGPPPHPTFPPQLH